MLSLGKPISSAFPPNGQWKEAKNLSVLTDGETAPDATLWRSSKAAVWQYVSRVHLVIDLEQQAAIDEVTIRLLGGTQPGGGQAKSFPTMVEVLISDDGVHYRKAASYSRWDEKGAAAFGIPEDRGVAWVHPLRFDLRGVQGRWVGLRIQGTGMTASDEITVKGRPVGENADNGAKLSVDDFSVNRANLFFHRPEVTLATNAALPVPMGLLAGEGINQERLVLSLYVPKGVELLGGTFGADAIDPSAGVAQEDGGLLYQFERSSEISRPEWRSRVHFGRLYFRATDWKQGQEGELRYQYGDGEGWTSPEMKLPLKAVTLQAPPKLKTVMSGQGWWHPHDSLTWPEMLEAYRLIGFNTVSFMIGRGEKLVLTPAEKRWLEEARNAGFMVSSIDMTLQRMAQNYSDAQEIFCQYEDGTHRKTICPSYRGEYWKREVQRFAGALAVLRPSFSSQDIEVWKGADRVDFDFGPSTVDQKKCVRCEADYAKYPVRNPSRWRRAKGLEMWTELMTEARKQVEAAGGAPFRAGAYNFRPGQTYQSVWHFDSLYAKGMIDHSQVASYLCLYPSHLEIIGDLVRQDRAKIPKGSVMPWLTPGDGGMFPGEAFTWAVLEAYANGADGIWFWSNRYWDSDTLIAYHRAMHVVSAVEEIITQGAPAGELIAVKGEGRISGVAHEGRMFLLAADYHRRANDAVEVEITVKAPSELRGIGEPQPLIADLKPGRQTVRVPLEGARARALLVSPK